ncbi:MAG: GGDEF domain-containing protein [Tatlockia sp.]|jgi:diguanylate cyclase (GGDEF)-like protein
MPMLKQLDCSDRSELHARQQHLIFYTTYQLIGLCSIIITLYTISKIWYMVALISTACVLISVNLWLFIRTKNTTFCGHVITSVTLLTIIFANYLVGGVGTPYSIWFYVIPLLAVALIDWVGLFIYSTLSLLMIIAFGTLHIQPYYHLPLHQIVIIGWVNHLVAFLMIVTILNSLMRENKMYEKMLYDKNYLLQVEKDKFQYLSRVDQLTNLPNRQYFLHYLQEVIDSLAPNYCITVFFMDLDNLKYINDHYGHIAGDHLLRQTAKRLRACFREDDFIARLGGDEFTAIVLHTQNETITTVITQRIRNEFVQPIAFEDQEYSSSISIGLANYPKDAKTIADLMIKADLAMYASKKKC